MGMLKVLSDTSIRPTLAAFVGMGVDCGWCNFASYAYRLRLLLESGKYKKQPESRLIGFQAAFFVSAWWLGVESSAF